MLAGGRSVRMGRDKALVPLGGRPLASHALARLSPAFERTVVVTNDPDAHAALGAVVVRDVISPCGPLGGLVTALRGEILPVALVACDLPFVRLPLLRRLLALLPGYDAVVPRVDGRLQPLLAAYAPDALRHAEAAIAAGTHSMHAALEAMRVRETSGDELEQADPSLESFRNVNTPEALAEAERLLANDGT